MTRNVSKAPGPSMDNRLPLANRNEPPGLSEGPDGQFENDARPVNQSGFLVHEAWAGWYFMNEQFAKS